MLRLLWTLDRNNPATSNQKGGLQLAIYSGFASRCIASESVACLVFLFFICVRVVIIVLLFAHLGVLSASFGSWAIRSRFDRFARTSFRACASIASLASIVWLP